MMLKVNKNLIQSRQIPLHIEKTMEMLYSNLNYALNRPDHREDAVEFVEATEYALQLLWGFEPDRKKHTYWNKIKGCTCAQTDNDELFGTELRRIDKNCPWHGKYLDNVKNKELLSNNDDSDDIDVMQELNG